MTTRYAALGLLLAMAACGLAAPARAVEKITIGTIPNMGDGAMICAKERGYFAAQGLDVDVSSFATASAMMPLIARGDLEMIRGGVSVSFFNSVARGMPMRYFANSTRAPAWHGLIMRRDLAGKVQSARDLKGLRIGITAIGGLSEYELGKTLETVGLSLDDIETKPLGMPESVVAVGRGALDGAVFVPPFDGEAIKSGGWKLLNPDAAVRPIMEVSGVIYNTDWAKTHRDELDRFTVAYIQGARCYAEAAGAGANRAEMIDDYIKDAPVKDRALYETMQWPGIDPDGRVAVDSMVDQQNFYAKRGYLAKIAPVEAFFDPEPVERALAKLGLATK